MKRIYLIIICLFSALSIQAQDNELSERLVRAYRNHQNNHQNSIARYGNNVRTCITPLMYEVRANWDNLTQKAKGELGSMNDGRPTEDRLELTFESQRFLFHYSELGEDTVNPIDSDNSGTSDYVELMASVFEDFMDEFVELGYYFPPADLGEGGSDKYDIYVANFVDDDGGRSYGFVASEFIIEDNPNSPFTENNSVSSWMGMRNTYDDFSSFGNPDLTPKQILEVTAAHEFFHAIQFGIGALADGFYTEATATSMEDQIFPGYNDNLQYIIDGFNNTDVSFSWTSNDADLESDYGLRQYGMWTFFKRLRELYGDDIIKKITESYVGLSEIPGDLSLIDGVLQEEGSNVKEFIRDTWVTSVITMFYYDTYPTQTFSLAEDFFNFLTTYGVTFEKIFETNNVFELNALTISSEDDGDGILMPSGFDLHYFTSGKDVDITIGAENDDDFGAILYYIDPNNKLVNQEFVYSELNEAYILRVDEIDAKDNLFILGVFNLNENEREFSNNIQYQVNVELASDCELKTWYLDSDGDGFGDPENMELSCVQPSAAYVENSTDCNDGNADIFPGAPAKPDGLDNDCDGSIDKVDQTITFTEITDQSDDNSTITVSVSSDSELPVTIEAQGPATVSGTSLTLTGAGSVSLTFSQTGNDGYNAATEVTTSFCVNPLPEITAGDGSSTLTLSSNYSSGNQWLSGGTSISGETGVDLVVSTVGSYSVEVTVDGCSATSEPFEVVLTAIGEELGELIVQMYPNPVVNYLVVETNESRSSLQSEIFIFDMNGKMRLYRELVGENEIDVTALEAGNYLLMIKNENSRVVKRFNKY